MAYSRDPNANFWSVRKNKEGYPPPMNYVSPTSTGQQPVAYEEVILHHNTSHHPIPVLHVDWRKGKAWAFETREDVVDNNFSEEMEGFPCPCPMRDVSVYIHEALQFLERGHSLLHPQCMCQHGYAEDRCRELGITPVRSSSGCSLPRTPREVTAQDIALELAVDEPCFQSFAHLLLERKLCNLRQGCYYSSARFFFGPLRSLTLSLPLELRDIS